MSTEKERWARLPVEIAARGLDVGIFTQKELAACSGISRAILANLMAGHRTSYHRTTISRLEKALQWMPGSISDYVAGGQLTPKIVHPDPDEMGRMDDAQ